MVSTMSLQSVRTFFAQHAPDIEVIVTEQSSATVTLAAAAHRVQPEQIAKSICLRVGEETMVVVMAGTARLDNRKFRTQFGSKPRMLDAETVAEITGHPVGGVCPFGLETPLPVYCDLSLKQFAEVVPAAGAINAAVRISPGRMAELTGGIWIDIAQKPMPLEPAT
jgi:prolyl-tRNA editing enzyme YbaK/EbsC (Cys-tRNA(Pro) deacylase)